MELLIFFGIILFFMLIEDRNIKKDIKNISKYPFTRQDAKYYYNSEFKRNK